ncbi:MAG: hypothetical protein H6741_23920 [Alphaproteobacteria bacterium]|nr:hypothetical protein [Alphaproteobacteria bacterium]
MLWLLLLACGARDPLPLEVPAEALAEAGDLRVTLRCAGAPDCQPRADAALAALQAGDWAAAAAAAAAGGGEWELRSAEARVVTGSWPVELPHPALPEGQLLARFTLVDGALVTTGGATAVSGTLDQARALLEAGAGEGWLLRCGQNGYATELGAAPAHVKDLSLSP